MMGRLSLLLLLLVLLGPVQGLRRATREETREDDLLLDSDYLLPSHGTSDEAAPAPAVGALRSLAARLRLRRHGTSDLKELNNFKGPVPLLNIQAEPPVQEEGAVHAASTACRAGCGFAVAMARSFAAQAVLEGGPKPSLHLFVETLCYRALSGFVKAEPQVLQAINLRLWNVSAIEGLSTDPTPHGKRCTMVRLFLPRLFPNLTKLIYLDADTVVVNSLRPVWDMQVPVLAMGENDVNFHSTLAATTDNCPTWKNGTKLLLKSSVPGEPDTCYAGRHGLNAGVVFFNLTGWRAHDLDHDMDLWSKRFFSKEIDMLMNDQDILNIVIVQHAEYFAPLPCEANLLHGHRWMCLFTNGSNWTVWESRRWWNVLKRNERHPIVLHDKFGNGANRQTWRWMYNRTNHFAGLVLSQNLSNASSLCGLFGCEGLLMEEPYTCPCKPNFKKQVCNCELRDYAAEDKEYAHEY